MVVAMATYQRSKVPSFAGELDPGVVQLHSSEYRNPAQLKKGPALIVGAGNSGSEIALDLTRAGHQVWMSGRNTGEIPFRISGFAARLFLARLVLRFVFHRVLTTDTPLGRKARPKLVSQGGPLIRVKARDLAAAGVERVPRTVGVRNGRPVLEDGRVLEAQNVVWCTGYHPGHSWIDLPVFDKDGEVVQNRGIAAGELGLYFVGLHFLYAMSSTMIHGVGRDAEFIAETIVARVRARPALESNRRSRCERVSRGPASHSRGRRRALQMPSIPLCNQPTVCSPASTSEISSRPFSCSLADSMSTPRRSA